MGLLEGVRTVDGPDLPQRNVVCQQESFTLAMQEILAWGT